MNSAHLLDLVRVLDLRIQAEVDTALRPIGLTVAQWRVLDAALTTPGGSSADLARAASISAQSMQALVANLEREGLLVRQPHPVHGRILQIHVSNAGEIRHQHGAGVIGALADRRLATFSDEELATFEQLLTRALGALSRR